MRRPRQVALGLALLVALAWWGDDPIAGAEGVSRAAYFHWLIVAFEAIASALGAVSAAVATSVAAAVVWLGGQVAWIALRLTNIVLSTGAIFARVWHVFERLYFNVLRPTFVWLHTTTLKLSAWLRAKFSPVFRFLDSVRHQILKFYTKVVRPILDTISYARLVLRTLARLGVDWARALDDKLAQVESVITANFARVLGALNRIHDTLERVITFDFLVQRIALLRSLDRDAAYWIRVWWNKQITIGAPLPGRDRTRPKYSRRPLDADVGVLRTYVTRQEGPLAPKVEELADQLLWSLGKRPGLSFPDEE